MTHVKNITTPRKHVENPENNEMSQTIFISKLFSDARKFEKSRIRKI